MGKDRLAAAVLGILFGGFGFHKFYINTTSGLPYILLIWTGLPLLIGPIEGIAYLLMSEEDFKWRYDLE